MKTVYVSYPFWFEKEARVTKEQILKSIEPAPQYFGINFPIK
jgi:hypothetical protein